MRLVTWNMQGGSKKHIGSIQPLYFPPTRRGKPLFDDSDRYAVCCLQEVTEPPGGDGAQLDQSIECKRGTELYRLEPERRDGASATLWVSYIRWTLKPEGNRRCSLAIVSRAKPLQLDALESVGQDYRAALIAIFDNIMVVSLHAKATGGDKSAYDSLDLIESIFNGYVDLYKKPFVIGGDFNCSPGELDEKRGQENTGKFVITHSGKGTHKSDRNIDYVVSFKVKNVNFERDLEETHGPFARGTNSDHTAQVFGIELSSG